MAGRNFRPTFSYGPIAQLVEHLAFNQNVRGSIPLRLTICLGHECPKPLL